ncbi:hypothetical protein ACFLS0_07980 [Candidatus Bipolaricaulota bacterium]
MHFIHVGKGTAICRIIILVVSFAAIGSLACLADQLQWNALSVCKEAAQAIGHESLLVSYCSQANEDYVELWLVRGACVVETSAEGLFEVLVLAKRLYMSQEPFSAKQFPVPADQWRFNGIHGFGWVVEGIDMAYTYIYTGGSSFHCLGKVLELECLIGVETITLPAPVMEKVTTRRSSGYRMNLQSFDHLPARQRAGPRRVP